MISKERIIKEFCDLVACDSPSYGERAVADALLKKLNEIGFSVREDDVAEKIGGNAGNLYAFLDGELQADPILFCAHMDTVEPSRGKRAVLHEDGTITSAGDTVLGGDDICALVEILEGIRHLREEHIPHRPVELFFTVGEEVFGKGVKAYDYEQHGFRSKESYVLDLTGPVGSAALSAPSMIGWKAAVKGKAAHAGFNPEAGVHAILAASKAISKLSPGWIGTDTTMNIGTISGGLANNIVPEICVVTGEVRSLDHEKACRIIEEIRKTFEEYAEISFETEEHLRAYHTPKEHPVVRRFLRACQQLDLPGEMTYTLGGSDNNILALHGITGIVLSCGMQQVHSTQEYTEADDLVKGASLVAALSQDVL